MLLEQFTELLTEGWDGAFAQERTQTRAAQHAVGTVCAFGRRTVSRTICAIGRQHQDWSADYKMFSRSPWERDALFDPVIKEYLDRFPEGPISVGFDDTKLKKTGKKIKQASWQRDPMSPPFHVNFIWGLRFAHASLLFPLYRESPHDCRGVPVRFWDAPALKKPGKRASAQQRAEYGRMRKTNNLSFHFLDQMMSLRQNFDKHGAHDRALIAAVDGSLCNQTIFKAELERVRVVARCRKDAKLCFPAPAGSRRKYGAEKFQPQEVRADDGVPWQKTMVFFGGAWRPIRYKEVKRVLWQRGAGRRELRLIVIAPQPYKTSRLSRTNYREPAYLLSSDVAGSIEALIQSYFDRWQIEVNHRDAKQILGIGQSQVWSENSVPRQPSFAVSVYSMLLLAGLKAYGPGRTDDYVPLPKWRRKARRPSALDLVTLIRKEINETQDSRFREMNIPKNTAMYAYG
jgi:hypothetical protein